MVDSWKIWNSWDKRGDTCQFSPIFLKGLISVSKAVGSENKFKLRTELVGGVFHHPAEKISLKFDPLPSWGASKTDLSCHHLDLDISKHLKKNVKSSKAKYSLTPFVPRNVSLRNMSMRHWRKSASQSNLHKKKVKLIFERKNWHYWKTKKLPTQHHINITCIFEKNMCFNWCLRYRQYIFKFKSSITPAQKKETDLPVSSSPTGNWRSNIDSSTIKWIRFN